MTLRELRLWAGLTQREAAAAIRVSYDAYHYWETGEHRPQGRERVKLHRWIKRLAESAARGQSVGKTPSAPGDPQHATFSPFAPWNNPVDEHTQPG